MADFDPSNAVPEDDVFDPSNAVPVPEGSALDAIIEPIQAIGASLLGEVEGGLKAAGHVMPSRIPIPNQGGLDQGISDLKQSRQKWAERGATETQAGQAALKNVGDVVNLQAGVVDGHFLCRALAVLSILCLVATLTKQLIQLERYKTRALVLFSVIAYLKQQAAR